MAENGYAKEVLVTTEWAAAHLDEPLPVAVSHYFEVVVRSSERIEGQAIRSDIAGCFAIQQQSGMLRVRIYTTLSILLRDQNRHCV